MKTSTILYQELVHNAWAAEHNVLYKGWILRLSEGITQRANSVLTIRYLGNDVITDIRNIENIFQSRNLPPIFQVADYFEPSNLIKILIGEGYHARDETIVMSRSTEISQNIEKNENLTYLIEEGVPDIWFKSLTKFSSSSEIRIKGIENIISRSSAEKITCFAQDGNEITGIVLGLREGDYIGIYNLTVDSQRRRERIGKSIMLKLMDWAHKSNIGVVYLAVEDDNVGARKLYQKLNFEEKFKYRYFVREE